MLTANWDREKCEAEGGSVRVDGGKLESIGDRIRRLIWFARHQRHGGIWTYSEDDLVKEFRVLLSMKDTLSDAVD